MPFSKETLSEKPYNACIRCEYIGITCDGPNFLAMSMDRLSEWSRIRKDYLNALDPGKWTNAYIAERSGLSKMSVDRFLSGKMDDGKISTVAPILKTLVNGSWGQYPCAGHVQDQSSECDRLREEMEKSEVESQKKIKFLRDQIAFRESQLKSKERLLDERYNFLKLKDRAIAILSVLLGIFVLLFIAGILVDLMQPDRGFFWITKLRG